ncbi:MAG: hypothetical protein AAF438_22150 [Pseudomonadota bacterium]
MEKKKMRCLVLALIAVCFLGSGCSIASRIVAGSGNPSGLEFQGINFRVNAAHEAFIGSIGLKRTEGRNRYELKFTPVWDGLILKNTSKFDRSLMRAVERSLQFSGDSQASAAGVQAALGTTLNAKEVGKFHLFRIVDTKSLVDQLNSDENRDLRRYLRRSADYRIVTSTIVVYSHDSSLKLENTANLRLALTSSEAGSMEIEAKSDSERVETLSMSDGTIYAYEFSRLCWTKKGEVSDILLDRNVLRGDSGACADIEGADADPRHAAASISQ